MNAYNLPPKLATKLSPNKSKCSKSSGLVEVISFLDLKKDFYCLPSLYASQILSLTNLVLGNHLTNSFLDKV